METDRTPAKNRPHVQPSSKCIEENSKVSQAQRSFPDAETPIINDYSCAYLLQKVLRQGRLYVEQDCIRFQSAFAATLVVEYEQVERVEKRKTLGVFNNAIQITLVDGQRHFFTSFIHRDQAFATLQKQLGSGEVVEPNQFNCSQRSSGIVGGATSGEDISEGSTHIQSDYESDSEDSEKGGEDSAPPPRFGPTTFCGRGRADAKPPLSQVGRSEVKVHSLSIPQPHPSITEITQAIAELGDQSVGTEFGDVILKRPLRTDLRFPSGVRLEDIHNTLLQDGSFYCRFLEATGARSVEVDQEWVDHSTAEGVVWARSRNLQASKEKYIPKPAWLMNHERQTLCCIQTAKDRVLMLLSSTKTPEAPYGSCFLTGTICLWREVGDQVNWDIYVSLHFVKPCMMKRIIENAAYPSIGQEFEVYIKQAHNLVERNQAKPPDQAQHKVLPLDAEEIYRSGSLKSKRKPKGKSPARFQRPCPTKPEKSPTIAQRVQKSPNPHALSPTVTATKWCISMGLFCVLQVAFLWYLHSSITKLAQVVDQMQPEIHSMFQTEDPMRHSVKEEHTAGRAPRVSSPDRTNMLHTDKATLELQEMLGTVLRQLPAVHDLTPNSPWGCGVDPALLTVLVVVWIVVGVLRSLDIGVACYLKIVTPPATELPLE
mmetsp:Transcript_18902/g.33437  ORF Transcript_18902/g.33437 Transcript_18902/m.33437 type:complete len:655 (-) Transcript_18902:658-2622(-)